MIISTAAGPEEAEAAAEAAAGGGGAAGAAGGEGRRLCSLPSIFRTEITHSFCALFPDTENVSPKPTTQNQTGGGEATSGGEKRTHTHRSIQSRRSCSSLSPHDRSWWPSMEVCTLVCVLSANFRVI